jgi:hypothetical protein
VSVWSSELRTAGEVRPRVAFGRSVARVVKLAAAAAAVAGLGVFTALARATHPGSVKHAATLPALSAPKSFVQALNTGLAPGSIGPASGPAQAATGVS